MLYHKPLTGDGKILNKLCKFFFILFLYQIQLKKLTRRMHRRHHNKRQQKFD